MDFSKLKKSDIEQILNEVVDATIDELAKGEIMAGGPTNPNHGTPNLDDDFAEAEKISAEEGTTSKAAECDEKDKKSKDDDEDDEDEKEDEGNPFANKSNSAQADLIKAQMKGMIDVNKAIAELSSKVDSLSKSRARDRKSAVTQEEVEVIEKSKSGNDIDELIKANKKAFGKALCDLHKDGKISGKYVTEYELFGADKVPTDIKKSILKSADLLK